MPEKPRTFEHFPEKETCPACGTSEAGECILIPTDGTQEGGICKGTPVHLWCALATRYCEELDMLYRLGVKIEEVETT